MRRAIPSPCNNEEEGKLRRRGPWTLEEDTLLTHSIDRHGQGRWNMLARCAGLKRTGKSCRLRWLNYLKPDIKRGNLTPQEQLLILELHSKWGNRWSKIAKHLPGRTDNEIKNYWRTKVQRQIRMLNTESNSKNFLETARCFWMTRLVQKVEQAASSSSSSSSLTNFDFQSMLPPESEIYKGHSLAPPSPISTKLAPPNPTSDQSFETLASAGGKFYPSSESMCFSDQVQLFNYPTSSTSNLESNIGYDMANNSYLAAMSAMDGYCGSTTEGQMGDEQWTYADMSDTLWNIEMRQFRE